MEPQRDDGSRRVGVKDIGRCKGGTGCQQNEEKDRCQIVVVHDLFVFTVKRGVGGHAPSFGTLSLSA